MNLDRLPIFLKLTDKPCLVVGGGTVAERKVRLLQRTGAKISVLASSVTESLQAQIDLGRITYLPEQYSDAIGAGFWLIIAATDDESLNHRIAMDADVAGRFCNVVDDNAASSFILPAIVDRSPIIVAIGTEGNAPVLAQQLKNRIEAWIPQRIGDLAAQAGRWRDLVKKRFGSLRERRRFWQRFFTGPIAEHLLAGRQVAAEKAMRAELVGEISDDKDSQGEAWIVGAGPGDPGLVTLRGQQLIGRADVVLYDRLVSKPILDFARKEAELIPVGKRAGSQEISQQEINELLVKLVREGNRVCRLKGGDPFVFGRGGEEALSLAKAGLPFQIVPGITAALGCAAYAGIPLTLRGVSGSVTLATAKLDKDLGPDWPQLLNSGHTLALYMGVGSIADIRKQLIDGGVSPDLPVAIVENGTTKRQRTIITSAATLEVDARKANIVSPAMVFIGKSVGAAEHLQWFDGQSMDSDVILDDLHTSQIDYLRLIETG
ncbi:MAG: uroporphyrinogen-III C-methyltransferase [Proteobacteria bacterium]|nr:uroporphyrinogen-III C-methyltransferase [Pseudomonadota bacterium]